MNVTEILMRVKAQDGRSGSLQILKGVNNRTILLKLGDDSIILEQDGVEEMPHYQVGVVTGKLHRIFDERKINGKWKVRNFVLSFDGDKRGVQHRLYQGVGTVIEKLNSIPVGANVVAEIRFLGNEWFNRKLKGNGDFDYWNLDEVHDIHTF